MSSIPVSKGENIRTVRTRNPLVQKAPAGGAAWVLECPGSLSTRQLRSPGTSVRSRPSRALSPVSRSGPAPRHQPTCPLKTASPCCKCPESGGAAGTGGAEDRRTPQAAGLRPACSPRLPKPGEGLELREGHRRRRRQPTSPRAVRTRRGSGRLAAPSPRPQVLAGPPERCASGACSEPQVRGRSSDVWVGVLRKPAL